MNDELLRVDDAAGLLGIKPKTLYGWASERKVPFRKHGGRLVFSRNDLMAWSNSNKFDALSEDWQHVAASRVRKQRRRNGRSSLKTEHNASTATSKSEEMYGDL